MAITPPAWAKDAIPTAKGWTHPRTGEVLKAQKFSQAQLDEYFGNDVTVQATPQPLFEAPVTTEEWAEEHYDEEEEETEEEE
tara:strand:+ start:473 stop:718 length:246 start_codon:yes stop_codon:yes gene_type:complete